MPSKFNVFARIETTEKGLKEPFHDLSSVDFVNDTSMELTKENNPPVVDKGFNYYLCFSQHHQSEDSWFWKAHEFAE